MTSEEKLEKRRAEAIVSAKVSAEKVDIGRKDEDYLKGLVCADDAL